MSATITTIQITNQFATTVLQVSPTPTSIRTNTNIDNAENNINDPIVDNLNTNPIIPIVNLLPDSFPTTSLSTLEPETMSIIVETIPTSLINSTSEILPTISTSSNTNNFKNNNDKPLFERNPGLMIGIIVGAILVIMVISMIMFVYVTSNSRRMKRRKERKRDILSSSSSSSSSHLVPDDDTLIFHNVSTSTSTTDLHEGAVLEDQHGGGRERNDV